MAPLINPDNPDEIQFPTEKVQAALFLVIDVSRFINATGSVVMEG